MSIDIHICLYTYIHIYTYAITILVKSHSLNIKKEYPNRILDFPTVNNVFKIFRFHD